MYWAVVATDGQFKEGSSRVVHIETSGFAVPTSSYTAALPSVQIAYSRVEVCTMHYYSSNTFMYSKRTVVHACRWLGKRLQSHS